MTYEEFDIITRSKVQTLIEQYLDKDPATVALSLANDPSVARIVASQVKYLARSRKKLPNWYKHRCIMPARAFEQASSENSASLKEFSGETCLDLGCGLGVDSYQFSQYFSNVTAVEADPLLTKIVHHNFQKMEVHNIRVINQKAEEFLAEYRGEKFDLVYLDPDRRAEGERVFLPGDCEPNVIELYPRLQEIAQQLLIKFSPLYDMDAALNQFPDLSTCTVISINNECKEVLLHVDLRGKPIELQKQVWLHRKGQVDRYSFPFSSNSVAKDILTENIHYIFEPDVAFYQSRTTHQLMVQIASGINGTFVGYGSYFFSEEPLPKHVPGKMFEVQKMFPYKPKVIKKALKKHGITQINITKRNFPFTVKKIRNDVKLKEGGDDFLLCAEIGAQKMAFLARRVND